MYQMQYQFPPVHISPICSSPSILVVNFPVTVTRIKYCVISRGWFFHLAASCHRGKVLTGSAYGFRRLLPKLCFLALPLLFSPASLSDHTYSSHALSDIRQPDRHVTRVQPSRFIRSFLLSLFSFVAIFQATVLIYTCLLRHAAGDIAVSIGGDSAGFQLNNCFQIVETCGICYFLIGLFLTLLK